MGNSENRITVIYYILLWTSFVKPISTTVTLTTFGGTGIVKQQPLTLRCNYTKHVSDQISDFDWRHGDVVIVSGSIIDQNARFQTSSGWDSGLFLGNYVSSLTIQLPASNVTPSIAGQYTCRLFTLPEAVEDTATATVNYAPKIESTFPSNRTVTESNRLQIDCSSYTTPGNPPTTSYTWTYGGSTISSGAVLDINNIGRDRRGLYTCTSINTVGSGSETVIVNVQYGPKIESTFPSIRTVTELSRLQIDCSSYTTPGNPPTTSYTWTYGGSTIRSEAVLEFIKMKRHRRGQYTCKASNAFGTDSETVSVDVQYLDRPELFVNKTELVENETLSLKCNVESNPTAQLEIRNVDNNTVLVEGDTNRLQFTIDRVQCLHNGSILCTARNTQIGNASYSASKDIDVKCSPRQDFRHKLDNVVVNHINEAAALVADVIGNPVPVFRWFRKGSGGLTNISMDTVHSISNSRLQSVLYINISRTRDYGDYILEMENSQGRSHLLFTLTGTEKSVDEDGSILPIVVGSISAVVVASLIVGVFLYRRRHKGLDCFKRKSEVPGKMEMTENEAYASSSSNAGVIYAMPNKQKKTNIKANADVVYAKPNKQKKANTKDVVYENPKTGRDNGGLQADKNVKIQVPKVGLDEDGLTYIQIDTSNQKQVQKPRTTPRSTAYASISYGQVGYPLPVEDENE